MRPPYSVLARRMGPGGAGATRGPRERERVAYCASPSNPDPECVTAAYYRDWRRGPGKRVHPKDVDRRPVPSRPAPDSRRTSASRTNAHPMPPICDE